MSEGVDAVWLENNNVICSDSNNIKCHYNNIFSQKVIINGEGKVNIGNNTILGYELGIHFYGFHILLQSRYKDSIIKIGDNTMINNDTNIIAVKEVSIGNECRIGDRVTIFDCDFHEINPETRDNSYGKVSPVKIGNNVWIGSMVTISKGVTIGDNCVIGNNSVVSKSIPENCIAKGNPAIVIGCVFRD